MSSSPADPASSDQLEPPRVAILGGGMAGLSAAWRLTDPDIADQVGQVTVYQRGARLGGKGASHRGINGRIEEHGLHVWLGYYDNAFRLMREVYGELDRSTTLPECPIRTWTDAFEPAPVIGVEEFTGGQWSTWTALFPNNDRSPGDPIDPTGEISTGQFVTQAVKLMGAFITSLDTTVTEAGAGAISALSSHVGQLFASAERSLPLLGSIRLLAESTAEIADTMLAGSQAADRTAQLVDLIAAQLRGIQADNITQGGLRAINDQSYREWLRSHGASERTLDGALLRGLHDLAFSHRHGDRDEAEFPAGLGLFLATKTFFDYRGALFYKMTAGMGDVVMAPMYQALRDRGVRFEFFTTIDELIPDGANIDEVRCTRQVDLAPGIDSYRPLQNFAGLPCFPRWLDTDQLATTGPIDCEDLEGVWHRPENPHQVTLRRGIDFDELVYAIPPAMSKLTCQRLAHENHRWAAMLEGLETVPTQSFQIWLRESEEQLGWSRPQATITGYVDSYDTWSSMTHLLPVEQWPAQDPPHSLAYFCSTMTWTEEVDPTDPTQPIRARELAQGQAASYLERDLAHYLPGAVDGDGAFRWDLLAGSGDLSGPAALNSQYIRANVDPSDQYVQALPGTDHLRLRPSDSGFGGLHLAGDWTDCGLNAGCIEGAVISGIGAANSVLGLDEAARITGSYLFDEPHA